MAGVYPDTAFCSQRLQLSQLVLDVLFLCASPEVLPVEPVALHYVDPEGLVSVLS